MIRVTRISSFARDSSRQGPARTRAAWATVQRQPSWLVRATLLAFLLVVGLPLLLLFLLAMLVAVAVFAVLFGVNALTGAVRGTRPGWRHEGGLDGRENVRVIRRDDA